ncbi:MAG: hypothetical protein KatS3mg104_3237 [Phycisphaerae bacterium]|nr:MAG: hypothetical protein KatS3mg104_3237 [Phycisphaerae bacterium]
MPRYGDDPFARPRLYISLGKRENGEGSGRKSTGDTRPCRTPLRWAVVKARRGGRIFEWAEVRAMRWRKRAHRGQNLIEYAIVVAVVISALIAMSTYVFRAVQATTQKIQREFGRN